MEDDTKNSSSRKIDINKVVIEYLIKYGYNTTLDAYQKELASKTDNSNYRLHLKQMVQSFESGSNGEFFSSWNKYMSQYNTDNHISYDDINKLEFYLHIYFCIYPIHSKGSNLDVRTSITHRRLYLKNESTCTSHTSITKEATSRKPQSFSRSTPFPTLRISKNTKHSTIS